VIAANRIAVIGAGGVGGYLGALLARADVEVHFIARGQHFRALKTSGLRIRSGTGDFTIRPNVVDDPRAVGPCDYVLVCVKSFDTEEVAAAVHPLVGPGTAVVSLQNGVDNEERIAARIGWDHVMGGTTYVFAAIVEPGLIEQTGSPPRLVLGEWDGTRSRRALRLRQLFRSAAVEVKVSRHIKAELWYKFGLMCALGGMTAAVRLPIGAIRSVAPSWQMLQSVAAEVRAIAEVRGVRSRSDVVVQQMRIAERLPAESYSSLYYDLTRGKQIELEALHGAVVRMGRESGVATPACEAIYALLAPWAARHAS
jgi:2-dehydropantoate 2-reductase